MRFRAVWLFLAAALTVPAQKYAGPRPSKPDLVYLLHADNLVATEAVEAKEETRKDDILYVVPGAASPVKTPLASPILLVQAEKLQPERLQLFKLESKGGQREVLFSRKKKVTARPLIITVTRLSSDNLFKIEVDQSLENGEYSLTPEGSNQVFCFSVY
jgi:hypothetical protein